jgi:predicted kinase
MKPTTVVLVTGHPGTGKTTLAESLAQRLQLPLTCKDQIKETLLNTLGWSTEAWARKLSVASWALLYQQVERLVRAGVDQIVESNFDPYYANAQWTRLTQQYAIRLVQIRCEASAEVLLTRYHERIANGTRHPGHIDRSDDLSFLSIIRQGPMDWIKVESEHLSVDTTMINILNYALVAENVRKVMAVT